MDINATRTTKNHKGQIQVFAHGRFVRNSAENIWVGMSDEQRELATLTHTPRTRKALASLLEREQRIKEQTFTVKEVDKKDRKNDHRKNSTKHPRTK